MLNESPREGRIEAIAIKPARGADMNLLREAELVPGHGIAGNMPSEAPREITLMSLESWNAALDELEAELPWTVRKANILLSGVPMAGLTGKRIRLGAAEVTVGGDLDPCTNMEHAHPGLQAALKQPGRGGIHATVTRGGRIAAGDTVQVVE